MKKRIIAVVLAVVMLVGLLATGAGAATYVVGKGDNLSKIADKVFGDSSRWKEIYEANKDTISDPNKIYVGQELVIPGGEDPVGPPVVEPAIEAAVTEMTVAGNTVYVYAPKSELTVSSTCTAPAFMVYGAAPYTAESVKAEAAEE